jgi:hypothetical protein
MITKGLVMELPSRGGESKDETDEGEAQSSETDRLRLWAILVMKKKEALDCIKENRNN